MQSYYCCSVETNVTEQILSHRTLCRTKIKVVRQAPGWWKVTKQRQRTESFGMGQLRRTESTWYPVIVMLSGVIKLQPVLKTRGKKSPVISLQKQLVSITVVKTCLFKAARPAPGYVQNQLCRPKEGKKINYTSHKIKREVKYSGK